ncbi:MAG: cysteine desulfurase [Patescibacteria group bacterium]|nr:cysteine desulfurase [Patescibacteria group bacterium]
MIYLDYASTTPLDKEVLREMKKYFIEYFGNPSSLHSFGQKALMAVDQSRELIKNLIQVDHFNEIIFTSSATESNNLAIKGLAYLYYFRLKIKPHFLTTEIDHPSILEPLKDLKNLNLIDYDFLPFDDNGIIQFNKLENLIKENTVLITTHYVNSEIGIIQPIGEISKKLKNINQKREIKILFHLDASQAPLTEDISVKNLGVDLMTLSGHKIYGPKGIACLYKKNSVVLERLISGSEQEFGLRSSTENVPSIVGFVKALEIAIENRKNFRDHVEKIKKYFIEQLKNNNVDFLINGNLKFSSPKILNIYFPQKTSQQLLIYLDQNKIFVSSGMACKSRTEIPNEVVSKIWPERAKNSIRLSFGKETKKKDIDKFVELIKNFFKK